MQYCVCILVLVLHTYIYWIHLDAMIIDAVTIKMQEDFFTNIFTFSLRKGCSRVAGERELETEHKLHILTSTTYDHHVVSFLFSWCSTRGLGLTLLDAGFLYGILSASSLDPKLHRGFPRAPSVGCGLPYHISSLTLWNSTGNCFGTPNSTELNNN